MDKHVIIQPRPDQRILLISDIHGHDKLFHELLNQLEKREQDILILMGDYINRSDRSLQTLHHVMALSKEPNVYVLKGNHEYLIEWLFASKENYIKHREHLLQIYYKTLLDEFIEISPHFKTPSDEYDYFTTKKYTKELTFIKELPTYLETSKYRIVHGGYLPSFQLPEDEGKFLKFDDFLEQSPQQDKMVIVGHTPCSNHHKNKVTNVPYHSKKNILFIDGGLGVKSSGELNGIIINQQGFQLKQVNNYKPAHIIGESPLRQNDKKWFSYPSTFQLIKKEPYDSLVLHEQSGQKLYMINAFVDVISERLEYCSNHFHLPINTSVECVESFGDYSLIKYQDEFGYVLTSSLKFH